MRFCMLTTFYPPWSFGGDAIHVKRLAHALADAGHEVTVVFAPDGYRTLGGEARSAPEPHPGVELVPVDPQTGPVSPLATYMTGRPLLTRRRLERVLGRGFDVLHFHNPSLLGGPGLLGMGEGIKLYTLHEQWLVCPTHVLFKYRQRVCEKPHCWRCTLSYGRPPQLWRSGGLLERSLEHVDALLAPSRTTASLHGRFADLVRIERVPHFIADPGAEPAAGGPREGRPYFLFVGRLERIKGVETLLAAFRRRRSEDLVIAGEGGLQEELRAAAADLPHVRFVGWREGEELDALYRGALATLVPTLGHESFPLVLLESFARGKPALVHRFGALAELADESGAALAYSSDEELDATLGRLAGDAQLRAELGRRGREAYLEHWTPDAHLSRYLGLIEELAA
jgi:glycosyltransferase involved in cell wall biosynthesis